MERVHLTSGGETQLLSGMCVGGSPAAPETCLSHHCCGKRQGDQIQAKSRNWEIRVTLQTHAQIFLLCLLFISP